MTTLTARPATRRATSRPLSAVVIAAIGAAVLLVALLLALGLGSLPLTPAQVVTAVLNPSADVQAGTVIWSLRLPRAVTAALVGAALASVGAVMQAVLRNPLADPGITGVSSGAAVGAVAGIVFGFAGGAIWGVSVAAFVGAALVALLLQTVLATRRDLGTVGIILVGVAISSLGGGAISLLIANAADDALARSAMFWLAGDLDLRSWTHVALIAAPAVIGVVVLFLRRHALDALALGDDVAATSGVDVQRERVILLLVASLVTGAAVAVSGIISFVGLIVPHAVRLVVGASHTRLLPLSALVGAIFLVLADTVARTAFTPVVVQTGVVCALVGAPVFLFLLLRRRGA